MKLDQNGDTTCLIRNGRVFMGYEIGLYPLVRSLFIQLLPSSRDDA